MSPTRAKMIEDREANVEYLMTLPLAELRRRQDINRSQFAQLRTGDEEGFLTLRQIEGDLVEAIFAKEFGA